MNLNTFKISIVPCVVCGYAFSDRHHIWPRAKGGKGLPTICLCPNHHRFANLVQAMLLQSIERQQIDAFAHQYFDEAFNVVALNSLIEQQLELQRGVHALYAHSEAMEVYATQLELMIATDFVSPVPERPSPNQDLNMLIKQLELED